MPRAGSWVALALNRHDDDDEPQPAAPPPVARLASRPTVAELAPASTPAPAAEQQVLVVHAAAPTIEAEVKVENVVREMRVVRGRDGKVERIIVESERVTRIA